MAALIAAVLILGQLRGAHTARTGPPAQPVPVVQLLAQTTSAVVPSAPGRSAAQPATVTHTVVPGDTLWGIAVQYYGDGDQWQAIYQANVGLPQPGGGALTDAHWIYPGWSLVIPGATQSSPAVPATSAPAPAASSVAPPRRLASAGTPAPYDLQPQRSTACGQPRVVGRPTPRVADRAQREPPTVGRPSVPSIHTSTHGARSVAHSVPTSAGPPPFRETRPPLTLIGRHAAAQDPSSRSGIRTETTSDRSPSAQASSASPPSVWSPPWTAGGADRSGGAPSAGTSPGRNRRARSPISSCSSATTPGPARCSGSTTWPSCSPTPPTLPVWHAPDVVGVELADHGLDVLVTGDSADPPAPFERRPDRPDVWHLPFTTDPGFVDEADAVPPLPLVLATVGQGAAGTVLVNVDHYGSVHITVAADRVEGTLAAMATELAGTTAPIGTASSPSASATAWSTGSKEGSSSTISTKSTALVRSDEKAIVLVDPRTTTDQLLDLVRGTENVHLVTAGPVAPDGTALVIDPEHPSFGDQTLEPVQPSHVSDDSLEEVQTLFELAEEDQAPRCQDGSETIEAHPTSEARSGREGDDRSILGEPTISVGDGGAIDLVQAVSPTAGTKARRVVELLVYLAAHDGTATRGEWLTDVSPDKALSDGYVRNLVLLTRRSLEAITGDPGPPRLRQGHPAVHAGRAGHDRLEAVPDRRLPMATPRDSESALWSRPRRSVRSRSRPVDVGRRPLLRRG